MADQVLDIPVVACAECGGACYEEEVQPSPNMYRTFFYYCPTHGLSHAWSIAQNRRKMVRGYIHDTRGNGR